MNIISLPLIQKHYEPQEYINVIFRDIFIETRQQNEVKSVEIN
jgi:hypothetical protein